MLYGYARVSSTTQSLDTQVAQLTAYGCQKIFQEKLSGRSLKHRTQFSALLDRLTMGDTVVVTKLDRFARSTQDALNTMATLTERGVSLVVLNMGGDVVDTSTAIGKLLITVLAGIAEFEADLIKERQLEGIAAAKARGVYKGRPRTYTAHHKGVFRQEALQKNSVKIPEEAREFCGDRNRAHEGPGTCQRSFINACFIR